MTEMVQAYYEDHPWFFDSWTRRHARHKNVLICSTGQSLGIGKTYWLLDVFEKTDPGFTIDQVVFNSEQFWHAVDMLPSSEWHAILWDDPTRGLNKREWYKELNLAVTSFMKTASRYKRKDLGFAVPAFDDLDIAVREVMTLEAQMKEAGLAKVHRVKRNKFGTPPFWKPYLGEVSRHVPKLAPVYEKKREEFHSTSYQKEEFEEHKKEDVESLVDTVYVKVKANPERYKDPKRGEITAQMIVGDKDLHVSERVAYNVIARLKFERIKPVTPS